MTDLRASRIYPLVCGKNDKADRYVLTIGGKPNRPAMASVSLPRLQLATYALKLLNESHDSLEDSFLFVHVGRV